MKLINLPKKIYLNLGLDLEEDIIDFKDLEQVSWCEDQIEDYDPCYHKINLAEVEKLVQFYASRLPFFCGTGSTYEEVRDSQLAHIAQSEEEARSRIGYTLSDLKQEGGE